MNKQLKELIERNNSAYKKEYFIESVFLTYSILQKGIKQICLHEKLCDSSKPLKLSDGIKLLEKRYADEPLFTKRFKHSSFKLVNEYNIEFKKLNKEMKYQLPIAKIQKLAKQGISATVHLNTSLVRFKNNA